MVARGRSPAHCIGKAPLNEHTVKDGATSHVCDW